MLRRLSRRPTSMAAVGLTVAVMALAGCGSDSSDDQGETSAADLEGAPSWCGPKKSDARALLDGFGGNSWRLVTTASGKDEARSAPASPVTNMPTARATPRRRSPTSRHGRPKGVDALVVFADAGRRCSPRSTNVYQAGIVMVPYRVEVGGKAGTNYTKFVGASIRQRRRELGQLDQGAVLPDGGNVLFLSGPTGNSQGLDELEGLSNVDPRRSTRSSTSSRST